MNEGKKDERKERRMKRTIVRKEGGRQGVDE